MPFSGFKPKSGRTSMGTSPGGQKKIMTVSGASTEPRLKRGPNDATKTKFTKAVVQQKSTFKGKLKKGERLA